MAIDVDSILGDDDFTEDDNSESNQIHMYVDGNKAYLLEDEELDNLSKIKNDLYDDLGNIYIKEENFNKLKSGVNGAFIGILAMLDLGVLTGVFANTTFAYSTLGLFGTTVVGQALMWSKSKKLKSEISELENNYEIASKAYSAKNEEVAGVLIDKENNHGKAYM
ncbi:MAG: hypothetical protein IKQ31_00045 [Clostridia bacterium]|nr:hypothetical protein [Clostridia bacterium]